MRRLAASLAALTLMGIAPAHKPSIVYVRPSAINHHVNRRYDYDSLLIRPAAKPVGRLFLFLPGTWAPPRLYSSITSGAALHGYHAIALDYQNMTEVDAVCGKTHDANCWGSYRNAVITGAESSLVHVNRADSVIGRLIDLLTYAARKYPGQGWDEYLSNGQPNWRKIYVGGHSQGGNHSAYLGKLYELGNICALDALGDRNAYVSASWLRMPQRTPVERVYGFTNELDTFLPYGPVAQQWAQLGLPGKPTDVDATLPPYGGSHRLYTVAKRSLSLRSHDVTTMDQALVRDANGTPVYAPVWRYACYPS